MSSQATVTADELFNMPDDGMRHELVAGQLRSMPFHGWVHGWICANVGMRHCNFIQGRGLGIALGPTGFVLATNPDTVLAPDIAFLSAKRVAEIGLTPWYVPGAPDLVVEVNEPDETGAEIGEKIDAWLSAGTQITLVVDPERRTVVVHRPGHTPEILAEGDTLTGLDPVPGWTVAVRDLFAE